MMPLCKLHFGDWNLYLFSKLELKMILKGTYLLSCHILWACAHFLPTFWFLFLADRCESWCGLVLYSPLMIWYVVHSGMLFYSPHVMCLHYATYFTVAFLWVHIILTVYTVWLLSFTRHFHLQLILLDVFWFIHHSV